MKGRSPLLSVCVPTYNQPQEFRRLFLDLLPQLTNEVEVVIRDDSTSNEVRRLLDELKSNKDIRYFHGEKEGLDAAILFLTNEARGRYVWWIGDDLIQKDAIAKILDFLKLHPETSFLYLSSTQKGEEVPTRQSYETRKFSTGDDALVELVDMLGFITATLFERKRALQHLSDAKLYIGTAWVNLFIILSVLNQNGEKYKMDEPLIISEPRDPRQPAWYDGFTVFAINFFNILSSFKGRFSKRAIRQALADNFDGIWKGILVYRAKGYTHDLGAETVTIPLIARYYWSFPGFWVALPLLAMPRFIIKFLYGRYLVIRSILSNV